MEESPQEIIGRIDCWDPLMSPSAPHLHWSRSNLGEAMPGVLTPLCWSVWGRGGEAGARGAAYAIGGLSRAERDIPDGMEDRFVRVFYGRAAMQVEFMTMLGDRMPGTSGREAAASVFGRVPEDMSFHPTRSRYAAIAWRMPHAFATFPRRLRALVDERDRWWRESTARIPALDLEGSRALFREAIPKFEHSVVVQTIGFIGVVQPLYDALGRLVARTGVGDVARLSGTGGAEMQVVTDIWRASRGEIGLEGVIDRHGFHGPLEGELSSVVWREDPAPLRSMVERYAVRDEADHPARRDAEHRRERDAMERALLAAVARRERPAVRILLALAHRRIPMRGVAKRSFLQCFDVLRATARRTGQHLHAGGVLADPEDVFYLTVPELLGAPADDLAELVARRRARRRAYEGLSMPSEWTGLPDAEPIAVEPPAEADAVVTGVGVSPGVVEGTARVLFKPDFADVQPDEILVSPTTDPSWASIMFLSSGLVVDIGGALSHAAVVARELGIPCVVNTRTGTGTLRSGDRIRVDGTSGIVEIIERQPA